jgi:hypothetical protein
MKKINNFVIKLIKQYLFFLINFNQYPLSRFLFNSIIISIIVKISYNYVNGTYI